MATIISWALSVSLSIILIMIPKTKSASSSFRFRFCNNATMFSPNSSYQSQLNSVFNSLSSEATNATGFSTASSGSSSIGEVVYGSFLCRGDLNSSDCKNCVTTATSDLPNTYCPNRKVAVIWYDECMVRYSNDSFFGKMYQSPMALLWNQLNETARDYSQFTNAVGVLMNNVSSQAVGTESDGKKFGTGVQVFNSFQTLYGLAQCTPDLTDSECTECLNLAIPQLVITQGGRVLAPSCNIRYEIYPFYHLSSLQPSPPPPRPTNIPTGNTTPVNTPPRKRNASSTKMTIAIVTPVTIVSVALFACGIFLIMKKAKKYDVVAVETGEDFSVYEGLQYDLGTLQFATNNFSDDNKLGEGGFGSVYKGILPSGREIAVKKLSMNSCQGLQEFKNEVLLVTKLQHRNLVTLLGFCLDAEEKLLVYEYVPNKSLDYFLFDPKKQGQLSWAIRYKIIEGIARGMLYIHQDSQLRIIHRDLKASNILLDANFNAKVADFGMARIFGVDQTQANTNRVVGTYGYMSPEYAMHGQFSVKSDIYSFGVLILEIISGHRNSAFYESTVGEDLLSYAWRLWRDRLALDMVDPTIRDSCSADQVMRCLHLGLLCAQESVDERPTMATILLTLDSYSVTLPVPKQPGIIIKSRTKLISVEGSGSSHQSSIKSIRWSANDITTSEVHAR